jgi:Short C-terminal domain
MMRRRGPSLLGVVAVSAATTHVMQKNAQGQQQAQQQAYDQGAAEAQQQAAAAAPVAAAPAAPDMNAQLEQLAQLKNAGIITEDEFTAKKKQILGI